MRRMPPGKCLTIISIKVLCLAPHETPFSDTERGFAILAQPLSRGSVRGVDPRGATPRGAAPRANHIARQSPIYALLGHIGVHGGLNLCSPSTALKVNFLCMKCLCFGSVRGDVYEGHFYDFRCHFLGIPSTKMVFCAILGSGSTIYGQISSNII